MIWLAFGLIALCKFAGAICPGGYLYGIANIPDLSNGPPGTWRVFDTSCATVLTVITDNPCSSGDFGCTPSPIRFNKLFLEGDNFSCEAINNSGQCQSSGIQFLSLALLSRDVSRHTLEYTFSSAVVFRQLSEPTRPYHLRKQQVRLVDSFIKFSNGNNSSERIAMQISPNLPRTARVAPLILTARQNILEINLLNHAYAKNGAGRREARIIVQ
ncbi:hypothetical protein CPB85DRAFT_78455 [Mucidula mucida]|nr:hypothetical protein CPB85DRAFT_78455 [Mucidula mucida]